MSITLPPLPSSEPLTRLMRFAGKKRSEVSNPCLTARECIEIANALRARDLEVARVVLEGAANQAENTICSCCYPDGSDAVAEDISAAIRALEVRHHE